jgi:hypothetical protein
MEIESLSVMGGLVSTFTIPPVCLRSTVSPYYSPFRGGGKPTEISRKLCRREFVGLLGGLPGE